MTENELKHLSKRRCAHRTSQTIKRYVFYSGYLKYLKLSLGILFYSKLNKLNLLSSFQLGFRMKEMARLLHRWKLHMTFVNLLNISTYNVSATSLIQIYWFFSEPDWELHIRPLSNRNYKWHLIRFIFGIQRCIP